MTRINLIRESVAQPGTQAGEHRPWRWVAVFAVVAALHGIGIAWVSSMAAARDSLRRSVDDLERAATRLREDSPRVEAADHTGNPSRAAVRLRRIAASMPPDLWLVGYREHQGEAAMRGMSLNDQATRTFVDNLAANPVFGHIEIIETTRAGAGTSGEAAPALYEFQLKAPLHDAPAAAVRGVSSPG